MFLSLFSGKTQVLFAFLNSVLCLNKVGGSITKIKNTLTNNRTTDDKNLDELESFFLYLIRKIVLPTNMVLMFKEESLGLHHFMIKPTLEPKGDVRVKGFKFC